jgi:hypothetical protein
VLVKAENLESDLREITVKVYRNNELKLTLEGYKVKI